MSTTPFASTGVARNVDEIPTEIGIGMMAYSDVPNPVKPTDATHVGPCGDYWKLELVHEERTTVPYLWTGDHWREAGPLFIGGLLDLGLHFESITEQMPSVSLRLMVQRLSGMI